MVKRLVGSPPLISDPALDALRASIDPEMLAAVAHVAAQEAERKAQP